MIQCLSAFLLLPTMKFVACRSLNIFSGQSVFFSKGVQSSLVHITS
jgi:hypothetical protein